METELKDAITRIEKKLDDDKKLSPWVTNVAVPVFAAAISAIIALWVSNRDDTRAHKEALLKEAELLNTLLDNVSSTDVNKNRIVVEIAKMGTDRQSAKKFEDYAESIIKTKAAEIVTNGEPITPDAIAELRNQAAEASSQQSSKLVTQINSTINSVQIAAVAVSGTNINFAIEFFKQLQKNGFSSACVIKYSQAESAYSVILGISTYDKAVALKDRFVKMDRFNKNFPNQAFLQPPRSSWAPVAEACGESTIQQAKK